MQIGIVVSTFFTLLIPLAQSGTQLIIIRMLTGIGLGFALSAPFPIAAELMPAQHRRTFGAIYEVMLASAFTLLPFVGFVLADDPERLPPDRAAGRSRARCRAVAGAFRSSGKPAMVFEPGQFPDSGRHRQSNDRPLRRARPPGDGRGAREGPANERRGAAFLHGAVPSWPAALDRRGRHLLRHRAYRLLLLRHPVAEGAGQPRRRGQPELWAQHAAVRDDHTRQVFTAFIMEIIGRRWTISYCLGGAIPRNCLALMGLAHRAGAYATVAMTAGAMITGLTVLSSFPAVRVYLSEQFPTALRGRGHFFGEATTGGFLPAC